MAAPGTAQMPPVGDDVIPRVNRQMLQNMNGRRVRFVGKTLRVDQGVYTLAAPDGGEVVVQYGNFRPLDPNSPFYEFDGEVQNGQIVATSDGMEVADCDLTLTNEMITLMGTPQLKSLFSSE